MTGHREEYEHIRAVFSHRFREMMGNMTAFELSTLSGVSINTLCNWRTGRTLPDLCRLFSVCSVLGASIDWLVGLDADGAPRRTDDDTQQVGIDTQRLARKPD